MFRDISVGEDSKTGDVGSIFGFFSFLAFFYHHISGVK
jgi:hypothetical protein